MDNISWDLELEKIEPQELTEKEKQLAKECAEIETEFEETILLIQDSE